MLQKLNSLGCIIIALLLTACDSDTENMPGNLVSGTAPALAWIEHGSSTRTPKPFDRNSKKIITIPPGAFDLSLIIRSKKVVGLRFNNQELGYFSLKFPAVKVSKDAKLPITFSPKNTGQFYNIELSKNLELNTTPLGFNVNKKACNKDSNIVYDYENRVIIEYNFRYVVTFKEPQYGSPMMFYVVEQLLPYIDSKEKEEHCKRAQAFQDRVSSI